MSKKAWIIFIAICVGLIGALVYVSNKDRLDVSGVNTKAIQAANENSGSIGDHVYGNKDAKVVLIEYGDYQCPGCGSAYPTAKAVYEKHQDNIAFVFRNFPLTSLHPNARAAAAAAEAAGLQGKYWQMHDKLYENQSAWESLSGAQRGDFFVSYARTLGLNTDTFTKDLTKSSINRKINFDIALGKKDGVTGTPTFLLNGESVSQDVWSDATKFEEAVTKALKEKGVDVSKKAEK